MSNFERKSESVSDSSIDEDWLQQLNHEDDAISSKKLIKNF